MGLRKDILVKIEGQVDYEGNDYEIVLAKLKVICAEYDLDLIELPN